MTFQNELGRESITSLHLLQTILSLSRTKVRKKSSPREGRGEAIGRMTFSISRKQSSDNLLIAAAEFLWAAVNKCANMKREGGAHAEVDLVCIVRGVWS